MISSERYSVGSEDGRSISFQKEEGAFVGLDVTIKFKYVIVVIICAVAIMGGTITLPEVGVSSPPIM